MAIHCLSFNQLKKTKYTVQSHCVEKLSKNCIFLIKMRGLVKVNKLNGGSAELIFASALADRMSVSKEFVRLFVRIGGFTRLAWS